ncbi:hypothetical protein [Streptomyces olivaceus]|uniref:hypothetical protein n=1 Tax=Streptomyces olivaceus TaxID=47716 RepID=UPI001CCF9E35|nr:hypothetical protein [Streptomyces olivaceus]MBZ6230270.1 hypothetical protein [Streptomyces olivaceus]
MRWRLLFWSAVALGVLAAAALGWVARSDGAQAAASGLGGLLVAFCEIGAVLLAVTAWSAERRRAEDSAVRQPPDGTGEPAAGPRAGDRDRPAAPSGGFVVNSERIEKSQIGDGNTQHNS